MTAAGRLWTDAFRVERRGVDPVAGLAGALASCAPLAVGVAAGKPEIALIACFGGLNAALAVPRGVLRERVGWGLAAALACCGAMALATAVEGNVAASAAAAFGWVGLTALLRTLRPNGGLTGFVAGAIFVLANGVPPGSLDVGARVLWFALGSLAGLVLMVAAYARDDPPPRGPATPPPRVLMRAARQLGSAIASDRRLRAHAARIASLVAATTLLYKLLGLQHGAWVPLTVLAVLQPEEQASDVRGVQRAAGTLLGTVAVALITIATGEAWVLIACQGVAAFGLFALSEPATSGSSSS